MTKENELRKKFSSLSKKNFLFYTLKQIATIFLKNFNQFAAKNFSAGNKKIINLNQSWLLDIMRLTKNTLRLYEMTLMVL